jgi:hypothetical protein
MRGLQVVLARDLSLFDEADHERLATEVREIKRTLTSFVKSLRAFSGPRDLEPETRGLKPDA